MQHHRTLSRDEWLPARRRRLSSERELTRQRDQLNPERHRNESGPPYQGTDRARHGERHGGGSVGATARKNLIVCCGSGVGDA